MKTNMQDLNLNLIGCLPIYRDTYIIELKNIHLIQYKVFKLNTYKYIYIYNNSSI